MDGLRHADAAEAAPVPGGLGLDVGDADPLAPAAHADRRPALGPRDARQRRLPDGPARGLRAQRLPVGHSGGLACQPQCAGRTFPLPDGRGRRSRPACVDHVGGVRRPGGRDGRAGAATARSRAGCT